MDYQGPPGLAVNTPPNINQQNNAGLNSRAKAVKILALLELMLTIFCGVAGIVEASMASSPLYCEDDGYYYCHYGYTIGQAIWCSVFPLIASVIGITTSKKPTDQQQVRLLMGFGIVAAVFMGVLGFIELGLLDYNTGAYRSLQICIICASFTNFILFIISSSYGCCLGCCSDQQQQQGAVYITYTTPGNIPVHSLPTGMQVHPQVVMVNPSQLQGQQIQGQLQGQQIQGQLQGQQIQGQLQGQQLQGQQLQWQQLQGQQPQGQQIQGQQLQGQQPQGQQIQGYANPVFVQVQPPAPPSGETQVNPPPANLPPSYQNVPKMSGAE